MKVVILAGGKGTRISEYTKSIPKPMIKIGSKPIIEHIIKYYMNYGFKEFLVAGGYKYSIIKNYFKRKKIANIKVINTCPSNNPYFFTLALLNMIRGVC